MQLHGVTQRVFVNALVKKSFRLKVSCLQVDLQSARGARRGTTVERFTADSETRCPYL
jgi:hypothetical protein